MPFMCVAPLWVLNSRPICCALFDQTQGNKTMVNMPDHHPHAVTELCFHRPLRGSYINSSSERMVLTSPTTKSTVDTSLLPAFRLGCKIEKWGPGSEIRINYWLCTGPEAFPFLLSTTWNLKVCWNLFFPWDVWRFKRAIHLWVNRGQCVYTSSDSWHYW